MKDEGSEILFDRAEWFQGVVLEKVFERGAQEHGVQALAWSYLGGKKNQAKA